MHESRDFRPLARRRPRGPWSGLLRIAMPGAVCAIAVMVVGCGSSSDPAGAKIDFTVASPPAKAPLAELTWGLNGEPPTLDPIQSYNFYDDQVIANMCESLFRLNPDLTTSPLIATGARNPTPTTWVYEIRKGVTFWDGKPLTAADVVYSLRRNLDSSSYFHEYYSTVKDIRETGPYEVTVELERADALWNQVLVVTGSSILQKAWSTAQGKSLGSPKAGLMCTGPYKFGSWERGSNITLERNSDYWDTAADIKTEKVVFRFIENNSAQTQALLSGGVDGMFLIDPSGVPRLKASAGKLYFGRNLMLNYLIPTLRPGPLQSADVRKALALLVDRPGIVENIYHGAAQPMQTLVTPTLWGESPAIQEIYRKGWEESSIYATPNVEMAKQLFEKAGSPKDTITVGFRTGGGEQQIVEALQSAAREIGLNIKLKGYSEAGIVNLYYDHKAQVAAGIDLMFAPFNTDTADPLGLYQMFIPGVSVFNYSKYAKPEVTRLLTRAASSYDDVQRAKLVAAAERLVMEDMPAIPLVAPYVMTYMSERVTGSPTSYSVYWTAWASRIGAAE